MGHCCGFTNIALHCSYHHIRSTRTVSFMINHHAPRASRSTLPWHIWLSHKTACSMCFGYSSLTRMPVFSIVRLPLPTCLFCVIVAYPPRSTVVATSLCRFASALPRTRKIKHFAYRKFSNETPKACAYVCLKFKFDLSPLREILNSQRPTNHFS